MSVKPPTLTTAGALAMLGVLKREIEQMRRCAEHGLDRRCEHCDRPMLTPPGGTA